MHLIHVTSHTFPFFHELPFTYCHQHEVSSVLKDNEWNLVFSFPFFPHIQHLTLPDGLDKDVVYVPYSLTKKSHGKDSSCFLTWGKDMRHKKHTPHASIFLTDLWETPHELSILIRSTRDGYVFGNDIPCCLIMHIHHLWYPLFHIQYVQHRSTSSIQRFWKTFPHLFVISSPKRREYIEKELAFHSLDQHITWVDAIVPNEPSASLSQGQLGCFLSHLGVFEQAYRYHDDTPVMVLEDDVMVHPSLLYQWIGDVLLHLFDNIPKDWHMVYIGTCWDTCRRHVLGDNGIYKRLYTPLCSHAYIIRSSVAKMLFSHGHTPHMPFDHFLRHSIQQHQLNVYGFGTVDCFVQNPHLQSIIQDKFDQFIRHKLDLSPCVERYYNIPYFLIVAMCVVVSVLFVVFIVHVIVRNTPTRISQE